MKRVTMHKGFKIITRKKDGYYQSSVFYPGDVCRSYYYEETRQRDSIASAKWCIDVRTPM